MPVFEQSPALDHDQLRDITMGDEELMRQVLGALWDDTASQIAKLALAVQAADADQCMRLAHYSKGACANVGANAVAEGLRRIEADARRADFAGCAASLSELKLAMDRLHSEIIDLTRHPST